MHKILQKIVYFVYYVQRQKKYKMTLGYVHRGKSNRNQMYANL